MDIVEPNPLISLLPLLFWSLIMAGLGSWLAPRKGVSPWFALIMLIPCVGWFFFIYLLAQTDKKVLDDIETLKKRLDELESGRHRPPPL